MNSRILLYLGIGLATIAAITSCQAASPSPPAVTPIPTVPDVGSGPSKFTGTFMVDYRPYSLYYLSLTQTGNEISGFFMFVADYDSGGVSGTPISVYGNVGGDAITLKLSTDSGVYSYTGRKVGDKIILTRPSESGRIETLTFVPASQNTFNEAVDALRRTSEQRIQATQEAIATHVFDNRKQGHLRRGAINENRAT